MTLHIVTNWHRRDIVDAWQIPADVRAKFDYVDWSACDDGRDSVSFVRAYGSYWDLNDTEPGPGIYADRMPNSLQSAGWDRWITDTYFSGVCFRHVQDPDDRDEWFVIVGRFAFLDDPVN